MYTGTYTWINTTLSIWNSESFVFVSLSKCGYDRLGGIYNQGYVTKCDFANFSCDKTLAKRDHINKKREGVGSALYIYL